MSGARRFWTAEEDAVLRDLYPHNSTAEVAKRLGCSISRVYNRANLLVLHKTPEYLASPAACRLRRGDNVGAQYRFKKGQVPPNKGLRRPGWASGRMRETQFKKGSMHGAAQMKWKPVGTERISKDGYLERKISDEDYSRLSPKEANRLRMRRWKAVHILVWEEANGPLPKGHAVTFVNGDRKDVRLENLQLVSRADLARRNSIHNLPPELKRTIMALGQFKRRVREEQNRRSA